MNTSNIYNKHMSLSKRIQIEGYLNDGKNFTEISQLISKHKTTISREIKKHRILYKCNRYGISPNYNTSCDKLFKAPYVCNSCYSRKGCRKDRYLYEADYSNKKYLTTLSESRKGIDMTTEDFHLLNKIVSDNILKGLSFSMICNMYKSDFKISKRTLYNYVEKGYLDINNCNLPYKVRYKKRKKDLNKVPKDSKNRIGRTYEDFLKELSLHYYFNIVQMDTVEGTKGGKVLLTLLYPYDNFMFAFLMDDKTSESVSKVFIYLKDLLGHELFHEYFPIILTDNGTEFSNPEVIEDNGSKVLKTRVYYCDPRRSDQKANIENNHRFIRRFIPKGNSFDYYSQEDINNMINNINSSFRDKISDSPYNIRKYYFKEEFLNKLGLFKVDNKELILNKQLFNKKDNTNE